MTIKRREKKSAPTRKLDLESLGERIAPAVFHMGVMGSAFVHQFETHLKSSRHDLLENGIVKRHQPIIIMNPYPSLNVLVATSHGVKAPVQRPILVTVPVSFNSIVTKVPIKTGPVYPRGPVHPVTPLATPITTVVPTAGPSASSSAFPANIATPLIAIYQQYEQDPNATASAGAASHVVVAGDEVGVQIHDTNPAEFQSLTATLTGTGMTFSSYSETYGTVVGMLPISKLLTIAQFSNSISITPEYVPTAN